MSWMDIYERARAATGFVQNRLDETLCGCELCHYGLPQLTPGSSWAALLFGGAR